jgi:hypothetical protein
MKRNPDATSSFLRCEDRAQPRRDARQSRQFITLSLCSHLPMFVAVPASAFVEIHDTLSSAVLSRSAFIHESSQLSPLYFYRESIRIFHSPSPMCPSSPPRCDLASRGPARGGEGWGRGEEGRVAEEGTSMIPRRDPSTFSPRCSPGSPPSLPRLPSHVSPPLPLPRTAWIDSRKSAVHAVHLVKT